VRRPGQYGGITSPAPLPRSAAQFARQHAPVVYRRRRVVVAVTAFALLAITGTVGFGLYQYNDLSNGIHRSTINVPGVKQNTGATNILIMGLDSRLDENGHQLPAVVYDALHAGAGSDGGYNTNVLILIHIPGNGDPAVGISIPRDDYVALPGHPDGVSKSKIKEAYGLQLDQTLTQLVKAGSLSHADAYQKARDAARQAEISTVSQFLGGVPIDHFVEVTMAAFYQVAEAVQPITVCLNEPTSDPYSGANFLRGRQQLTATQAVAFVRQRRDENNPALNFTDLDRERRQQAFIISLAFQLKQHNTFTNIGTLESLAGVAKQNIAVDSGLNLLSFASDAQSFAGGNISFVTLPITGFATISRQDVNTVDLQQIRSQVAQLLTPPTTATPTPQSSTPASPTHSPSSWAPTTQTPAPNTQPSIQAGSIPCVK
jgi:LCP family protein required for cell wall assembly